MSQEKESAPSKAEIREVLVEQLKKNCPIAMMFMGKEKHKPCPHYGPSESCEDCTYAWPAAAEEVLIQASELLKQKKVKRGKKPSMAMTMELVDQIKNESLADMQELHEAAQDAAHAMNRFVTKLESAGAKMADRFAPFHQVPDVVPSDDGC